MATSEPDAPACVGRHGRCLSLRQYEYAIVALHTEETRPDEEIRRRELDLAIDHRLGIDFPRERREALWLIQQRIHARPITFLYMWFTGLLSQRWQLHHSARVAHCLIAAYSTVLDPQELRQFLGEEAIGR